MNKNRMRLAAAAAAVVAAGTGIVAAQPASAANYTSCVNQAACFWYGAWSGSAGTGAVAAFSDGHINDLLLKSFHSGGSGNGTPVGNNSHSAKNNWSDHTLYVYYGASLTGVRDTLSPKQGRNLSAALVNNNRSYLASE